MSSTKFAHHAALSLGAFALAAGVAAPAFAGVTYPGGGTWNSGVASDQSQVWSNYLHNSRNHGSSVINGYGELTRSACVGVTRWSYASSRARAGYVDNAYWRYC